MSEPGRDGEAVRNYERIRDEVARHRVVDAAEAVITNLWIGELEQTRRTELGLIAVTSVAEQVALRRLRKALAAGGPGELARARAGVAAVRAEVAESLAHSRALIEQVDAELGRVGLVDVERGRRAERDFKRLRDAWAGAYGGPSTRRDALG
jgi:hypothetical protein